MSQAHGGVRHSGHTRPEQGVRQSESSRERATTGRQAGRRRRETVSRHKRVVWLPDRSKTLSPLKALDEHCERQHGSL